jgi:hypothetical protein
MEMIFIVFSFSFGASIHNQMNREQWYLLFFCDSQSIKRKRVCAHHSVGAFVRVNWLREKSNQSLIYNNSKRCATSLAS